MSDRPRTVIHKTTTELETYEVVEEIYTRRFSRLLYSGRLQTAQSGIPLDGKDQMLFEYTQRLVELVEALQARDILMIGGGAFTLASYLTKKYQHISFDVVEPDKELEELAKKYFDLKLSEQIKIINDYGLHYLKNSKKKYDLIIIDAYQEESIPSEILSKKFAKLLVSALKENGLIASNVITTLKIDSVVFQLHSTYKKYFKYFKLYPATNDISYYYAHNLIYVASNQPLNLQLKYPSLSHLQISS
jgi:spermidine synthase